MSDNERDQAWDKFRKARRGYLHDAASFEAGYSAGRAPLLELVKEAYDLVAQMNGGIRNMDEHEDWRIRMDKWLNSARKEVEP